MKPQRVDLSHISAIILDMDGVVTSSARVHAAAWRRMFDEYLRDLGKRQGRHYESFDIERDYRQYVDGKPRYDGVKSFLESRGITLPYGHTEDPPDRETVCGLGNRKNAYFLERIKRDGADAYRSTVGFVEKMKRSGKKVAVISASRNAKTILQEAGISDLFDAAVDGVDSAELGLEGKPAPDIFLEAAKRIGAAPGQAAVIEDALAGVEAGKKGQFALVIGIDRSEQADELMKRGADIVVRDLAEIELVKTGHSMTAALPSALKEKDEILKRLEEGRPAIFLDYDGTLTGIVGDPAEAHLPPGTKKTLRRLAEHWTVIVVSGRATSDVKAMVGIDSIIYAGSHGFSIEGPGESFEEKRGQEFIPALEGAGEELAGIVPQINGVRVERKPFAIAVHFRQADDRDVPRLERLVEKVAQKYPDLRKTTGKKIFELRPDIDWDKGKALLYLVEKLNVDGSRAIPLYIGDDTTDEDAFHAIERYGISIVVSDENRPTAARYRLENPEETAKFLEEVTRLAERESSGNFWRLLYEGFEPDREKLREALCTLGNGYFATRGAAPESTAGEVHYPGTYMAGLYNRLESTVADHIIENESMVNVPNWLVLTFKCDGSDWFDAQAVDLIEYRQELDMRRGVLIRKLLFSDREGRRTRLIQRRFVHIRSSHLAAMETTITPENWTGTLRLLSALDGQVENTLVRRYQDLNNHHLDPLDGGVTADGIMWLEVKTNQSHTRIAEAARTRVFRNGNLMPVKPDITRRSGYVGQEFDVEAKEGESICIEKIAALYNSNDRAIANPLIEAQDAAGCASGFDKLLEQHVLGWDHLWDLWNIIVKGESRRMGMILNLHIFHLLQTVSPNTVDLDAGVPPRGLHGEAYRGLIMWDELFIFPLLNLRMPDITRALLRYRHRRLQRGRWAALRAGLDGALFPWQSGSNGEEQAQTLHLNPVSGRWIPDNSQLQRHINIAIAYNIWHYYQVTGDKEFLAFYGAEILIEIARFWSSKVRYDRKLDRYEICKVMGPDEFHDRYPDADQPGVDNNSYTNVMVVWIFCRVLEIMDILPEDRLKIIRENLGIKREELERWDEISRRMRVVFHDDGIISQFEGYGELEEFDWEVYRERYGDIHRLDRILEAEGDSPNRYKLSKQADVLMLFYLLSADELGELFDRLGYPFSKDTIPKNIEYYLKRTSHGSTLSRVVHSWVIARSRREMSWRLFQDALESDVSDVQGGTTHEGIHLGAMAGTVDIVQRCYTGIETRGDILWFNPYLPKGLSSIRFLIRYRGHAIIVEITEECLRLSGARQDVPPIRVGFRDRTVDFRAGDSLMFEIGRRGESSA